MSHIGKRLTYFVRQHASVLIRLSVVIAMLVYATRLANLNEFRVALSRSSFGFALAGTLFLAFQVPIAAWRWLIILNHLKSPLPFKATLRLTIIGLFLTQVLPGIVAADAARIWLATKAGCDARNAVNGVMIDRLIMSLVLILLALFGALIVSDRLVGLNFELAGWILLVGGLTTTAVLLLSDRVPGHWLRWRMIRAFAELATDMRDTLSDWRMCTVLVALSLFSYFNMFAAMYLFAIAVGSSPPMFWPFIALMPPVLLAGSLPISMAGWGTREVTAVFLLGTIGIEPTTALLISVLLGLASVIVSLPGAILYFLRAPHEPLLDSRTSSTPVGHR